ncbi:MAG: inositol monophosphatase [Acidimicrobiales bacterium]|nr:inositol monophosphatase [Acidimicrobiales bacterium]
MGAQVDDDELRALLRAAADAVADALAPLADWGPSGERLGQYRSDLVADAAVHAVLARAGVGVLSEESGARGLDARVVVVVDPLDGSTNASRRLPWYATSLCAVDADGPRASLVRNLVSGRTYEAQRGGGALVDGEALAPTGCTDLGDAVVGLSGLPPRHLGWRQFRAMGAVALDLCAVADGTLDAFVDCSPDAHGAWDYLGALLVCREAGVPVVDAVDRELVVLDHAARRTPVAAATPALLDALVEARRSFGGAPPVS